MLVKNTNWLTLKTILIPSNMLKTDKKKHNIKKSLISIVRFGLNIVATLNIVKKAQYHVINIIK